MSSASNINASHGRSFARNACTRRWRQSRRPCIFFETRIPKKLAQMAEDSVDVLIIGAGASGAAIAWSLADTRMHIVCLEQGDWMNPAEYPSAHMDWESRAGGEFSISPNRRGGVTDYPINETNSPIARRQLQRRGRRHDPVRRALPPLSIPSDFRVQDAGRRGRRLADRLRDIGALLRRERPHDGRVGPGGRSGLSAQTRDHAALAPRQGRHEARRGVQRDGLALVAFRQRDRDRAL